MSRTRARLVSGAVLAVAAVVGCDDGTHQRDDAGPRDVVMLEPPDAHAPTDALIERCFLPFESTRDDYAERLRGLWLAENVANWTGLLTESERRHAPFFTDLDWGSEHGRYGIEGSAGQTITLNTLDPWGADDDTDIELVYLEAMREAESALLTPTQIRDAWRAHVVPDVYVWVSNRAVRRLFDAERPVLAPSTSLLGANDQALMIDAQLTTEIFGALAPGRPAHALALSHLPILTSATGHAAHAAQLYVVLYALAPVVDPSLEPPARIRCLLEGARRVLPGTSKSLDILDRVLAAYDASADHDDWELARDELARALQEDDDAHGYRYLEWYESSVNLATGLLALAFGEGELVRTIQIGTLSGWDSDNGTATMGGLLGLLHGEAWVRDELGRAGLTGLSDRYRIARTRVGFPQEIYSLDEIAALALPRVEESLAATGGSVTDGRYEGARVTDEELSLAANPYVQWLAPSANREARARGETVTVRLTAGRLTSAVPLEAIVDGLELDASGRDPQLDLRDEPRLNAGEPLTERHVTIADDTGIAIELAWQSPQPLAGVRFVEGPSALEDVSIEVEVDEGTWIAPELEAPIARGVGAFAFRDVRFRAAIDARAVRVRGAGSGVDRVATLLELDGLRTP